MNALFPDRWLWMEKAREAAFGALAPDLRGLCTCGNQPLVALCGPTQVGKSTLAVLLAGVAAPHIDLVVRLLRGGRAVGSSATPVPCVYQRAPGTAWRFSLGPGQEWEENEKDVSSLIASLREKMEQNVALGAPYLRIQIPRQYFGHKDQADLPIIIDLPGVDARESAECKAADAFVTQTLPIADVILLVSSELRYFSELSASQELLLRSWLYNKTRFRVVVTRVVSRASIAQKLTQAVEEDSDLISVLRSHYHEQLNTYRSEEERLSLEGYPQLYPLEYGDSWEELGKKSERREVFLKAQTAMAVLLDELKHDIRNNAGMAGRIAQFYQMPFFIKKSYEVKIQYVSDKLRKLEDKLIQRNEEDVQIGEFIQDIECCEQSLGQDLKKAQDIADGVQYVRHGVSAPRPMEERSPRALLCYLDGAGAYLMERSKEYREHNPGVEIDLLSIMAQYQSQIKDIRRTLKDYVDRDNYGFFGLLDWQYQKDWSVCELMVENGYDRGLQCLIEQVHRWAKTKKKRLVAEKTVKAKKKQHLLLCLEKSRIENMEGEDGIKENKQKRDALIQEMVMALASANTIRRRLDDCYLLQFKAVQRELGSCRQSFVSFARLLVMRQDFEGLMATGGAHE